MRQRVKARWGKICAREIEECVCNSMVVAVAEAVGVCEQSFEFDEGF